MVVNGKEVEVRVRGNVSSLSGHDHARVDFNHRLVGRTLLYSPSAHDDDDRRPTAMTTATRPRQSLLELFDPLSYAEKVALQKGEHERSSPTPSTESGSDKENVCTTTPKGSPRLSRPYDEKCSETLFFKRTTSRIKAPEQADATRESFSLDPGSDASNLCLVELADELDKACKISDDPMRKLNARREPLVEISIAAPNTRTPSSISRAKGKNLISLDTPKYTPKSRSLSLKFAAGISGCDGMSPKTASPTTTSPRKSTPRQNLLSPSIIITTPIDRHPPSIYKSTTPPLRPPFSLEGEEKDATPKLEDSPPRFHDPPSSLGRGIGDMSSASLDIRSLGKRLDFSDNLLKDEPSFFAKLYDSSFTSEFELPKTNVERIVVEKELAEDGDDARVRHRRSLSKLSAKPDPVCLRARSKTPVPRSQDSGGLSDNSDEDCLLPSASTRSSSSSGTETEAPKRSSSVLSRRSSRYVDHEEAIRSEEVNPASMLSNRSRRNSVHWKVDDDEQLQLEERDDFDMKTYTAPKPASRPIPATDRARPRISDISTAKPLARSQSLSKRVSIIGAPPPSASLRSSTLGRSTLSRRSSIGIQLGKPRNIGFDMSASQGREDDKPKVAAPAPSIASKRLSITGSLSSSTKESAFGTTGRSGLRTSRNAPPSAFASSTLGRSSGLGSSVSKIADRSPSDAQASVTKPAPGTGLSRRSSIGLGSSLSSSTAFRRTSSVSMMPPPAPKVDASAASTKRPFARVSSASALSTERPRSIAGLSGVSSKLSSSTARAAKRLPTPSERKAF